MNFLAPFAFAFAAAIPVVVLFYLLKRKRVVRLVSSTVLWQKFLAETQASAPFQKLRHNWLLILQILLLLLAVLALSRPYFAGKSTGGRLHVVILDASASMQSTDEPPSRFEKARKEALDLVNAMHDNDQMVVLLAGAFTEVKQSATSVKSALRRAIESAQVSDTPTRLQEALKLAETLIRNLPAAEVHLFSDGAFGALAEFETSGLPLFYHRVGQRSHNAGITTLDIRPNPENPAQRAIFASIANYSTNRMQTQLEFKFDNEVLEVRSLDLGPRETSPQVFVTAQSKDGVYSVHLTEQDDLLADNDASLVSLLPLPLKILLVTAGNRWLEKAVRSAGLNELSVTAGLTDTADGFDLVILDNVLPLAWPSANVLAFRVANTNLFDGWSSLEDPAIVDWKSNHPLLRSVSFDDVRILESLAVKTPLWAVPVVESPSTPLILAGEIGRQRLVWVGFDIMDSSWPMRVSFPIFMANAVDWLNPLAIHTSQLLVQAGSPFRFTFKDAVSSIQVHHPDGTTEQREVSSDKSEIVFGDTLKRGTYRLAAGTNQVLFCVNLLEAAESDTTPKSELQFGKYAKVENTEYRRANLEIWRWFAALALGVLMFEWWYYHRRTA